MLKKRLRKRHFAKLSDTFLIPRFETLEKKHIFKQKATEALRKSGENSLLRSSLGIATCRH
jgi:hypothetical protein